MNLEDFKAGTFTQQYQYKSFSPSPINTDWTWSDPKVHTLLSEANLKLGELNAFSSHIPDIDIFIRMARGQRSDDVKQDRGDTDRSGGRTPKEAGC